MAFKPFKIVKDAADLAVDFGEQALVMTGLRKKQEASYEVNADGSYEHNVDLSDFDPAQRREAEQLVQSAIEKIEDLELRAARARRDGDSTAAARYEKQADAARENLTEIKWQLEHTDIDLTTVTALANGPVGLLIEGARRDAKLADRIEDAVESHQEIADFQGSAKTESPNGTEDSADWPAELPKDPAELTKMFEDDPEGFFQKLQGVGSEMRAAVIMIVQNRIQQNNQLMSTLTNFQKAQHDTQKAVIANLRV